MLSEFVNDIAWCESFFTENHKRLLDAYDFVVSRLDALNDKIQSRHGVRPVRHVAPIGGFFLWVDLSFFTKRDGDSKEIALEKERQLFLELIEVGNVYVAPGSLAFHSQEVGWFRIIFAARHQVLELAMVRLSTVLLPKADMKR